RPDGAVHGPSSAPARRPIEWRADGTAPAGRTRRSAQGRDMNTAGRSPYAVLGIADDATLVEARIAFRRLVRRDHPDTGGDGTKVATLVDAYRALARRLAATAPRPPKRTPTPYDAALRPVPHTRTWRERERLATRSVLVLGEQRSFSAVLDAELARLG